MQLPVIKGTTPPQSPLQPPHDCRYDWMFAFAMFMSLCVDVMVMSSAYVVILLVPVVLECQMCIC